MELKINETICRKNHLTPQQTLFALALRQIDKQDIQELVDKQVLIVKQSDNNVPEYVVSHQWNDILDEIICNVNNNAGTDEWYEELAKEVAKTFPKGKMQGTAFYYRCNTKELMNKLKKFIAAHKEYKPSEELKERIIDAATRYNREMDYNPHYRVLAKYFISKMKPVADEDGIVHNEEVSMLASYLENENQEENINNNWFFNVNN